MAKSEPIEVEGTIKMAYGGEACDASREGAIHFDSPCRRRVVSALAGEMMSVRQVPTIYEALTQGPQEQRSFDPFADLARHLKAKETSVEHAPEQGSYKQADVGRAQSCL